MAGLCSCPASVSSKPPRGPLVSLAQDSERPPAHTHILGFPNQFSRCPRGRQDVVCLPSLAGRVFMTGFPQYRVGRLLPRGAAPWPVEARARGLAGWLWSLLPLLWTQICNSQDTRTKIPSERLQHRRSLFPSHGTVQKHGVRADTAPGHPEPGAGQLLALPWSARTLELMVWDGRCGPRHLVCTGVRATQRREGGTHAPHLIGPGARTSACSHPTVRRRVPRRS